MDILGSSSISKLEERIGRIEEKIGRVDTKLDALLRHLDINYDPYGGLPAEIAQAVKDGNEIDAIKMYRNFSGAGLKEAKEFIEDGISNGKFSA